MPVTLFSRLLTDKSPVPMLEIGSTEYVNMIHDTERVTVVLD